MNALTANPIGLDGVVAAATRLSMVDGEDGVLVIGGLRAADLVAEHDFEGAAARLWALASETPPQGRFGPWRVAAAETALRTWPVVERLSPMDRLRAALAALDIPDGREAALAITAAVPVLVATHHALAEGRTPLAPDPDLGHAADTLRLLRGAPATAAEARALDGYLTTVIDHGMNASTFTCRVVIATRASMVSAVTAAYGALSGPLHGGAPGPVLDMLDAIGGVQHARPWLESALAGGERLMGFGHRIYRTRDPRADVLKGLLNDLAPDTPRLSFALAVEREARALLAEKYPGRRLDTNVEFYTALLLDALGIPRALFTPFFAIGRVGGWTAHALEHHSRKGRLIRPEALYDGELPD